MANCAYVKNDGFCYNTWRNTAKEHSYWKWVFSYCVLEWQIPRWRSAICSVLGDIWFSFLKYPQASSVGMWGDWPSKREPQQKNRGCFSAQPFQGPSALPPPQPGPSSSPPWAKPKAGQAPESPTFPPPPAGSSTQGEALLGEAPCLLPSFLIAWAFASLGTPRPRPCLESGCSSQV